MKFLLILIIAFNSILLYAQIQDNIPEMEKKHFQKVLKSLSSDVGNNYDIKYHRLEWELNPEIYYIKGTITTYFIPTQNSISELTFDFNNQLVIDSVLLQGTLQEHEIQNALLTITLDHSLSNNILDSISIYYRGEPAYSGFGSFYQGDYNSRSVIWTLSEPYGAKDWWPCKQNLNDKIDSIDVYVTTPSKYKVASNGILVYEQITDTLKTTYWKHRYPIAAYLIAVAVAEYEVFNQYVPLDNNDSLLIMNYAYPESYDQFYDDAQAIIEVMQFFNEKFIDYPFKKEKYGHAQFGWGGGMEHQTMSFMGSLNYTIMVHELSHQWFGDYITCGSWAEIWLNEGFARYCEALTFEEFFPEKFDTWRREKIGSVISYNDGSVIVDDTTSVSRIFDGRLTYNKAGMVLHMLRNQIGDEAFFASIINYLNDPEILHGYATTTKLREHFETVADTSLTEFFSDWIYGEGFPNYDLQWMQNSSGIVKIVLSQTPSHNSVDFFEMIVPIQIIGNETEIIKLHHTSNNQEFFFSPDYSVTEINFDPNYDIVTHRITCVQTVPELSGNKIKIHPNPAKSKLRIKTKKNDPIKTITIYNFQGKTILHQNIKEIKCEYELSINQLPDATYIIVILTEAEKFIDKFVKSH